MPIRYLYCEHSINNFNIIDDQECRIKARMKHLNLKELRSSSTILSLSVIDY
jgi:hypothetical protein